MKKRNTFNKTLLALAGIAIGMTCAHAQTGGAASVESMASAMVQKVATSSKELAALREVIATEKIGLAKRLTQIETAISEARGEYDKIIRSNDSRTLDISKAKGVAKQRQDEVAYVSSLMDEYARAFEGRLHVSETDRYKEAIELALLAPLNKDLSAADKFNRQIALIQQSVVRLEGLIGGVRFDGTAINAQGNIDQGRFALIGPVALFAAQNGSAVGLALPKSGSSKPLIHSFVDPIQTAGIASIVASGKGMLSLDPTLGGALKALIAKGSLWGFFKKGGPIMWPLLALAILALTVIIERILFLIIEALRRSSKTVRAIMHALEKGLPDEAIKAGEKSKDYVARCLVYALQHRKKSLTEALMRASAREMVRFTRGISFLDTVVTMAPLLGLLGTVTGMISAFGMLGGSELSAPTAITGGIAEALIATTFGLGIAVTALIPLNYLHAKCERARHEMEDAVNHLELLMKPISEAEADEEDDVKHT